MGIISKIGDFFGGSGKTAVDATKAIQAQDAANAKSFQANQTAGQRINDVGSSMIDPATGALKTTLTGTAGQIGTGLLGGLQSRVGDMSGAVDYTGLQTPDQVIAARMAGYNAYANPQQTAQLAEVTRRMAERGIPIGQEISQGAYGGVYDASNRALEQAYGSAVTAAEQSRAAGIANQQSMARFGDEQAKNSLGLYTGLAGLLPQGQQAQMATTQAGQMTMDQMQAQDKATQAREKGIADALKMGISLAAAPFTGGMSLGGAGLFNGLGPGGAGPQPGTYMSQYFTPAGYPTSGVQMPGGAGPVYN